LNIVHVTHEAVQKIGGIGAVLEGLITAPEYADQVDHTILLCPLFSADGDADGRLGPEGEVLYSSLDGRTNHPLSEAFRHVQQRYHVEIVYGRRLLRDPHTGTEQRPEVILIDVSRSNLHEVNAFKGRLYDAFGIVSTRYEHSWEYEMYVRLAEPGLAAVRAISGGYGEWAVVAHEFMGVPTALAAKLHAEWGMRTAFYAHEVSSVRRIIEEHPGHDTMFYNVMRMCAGEGRYLPDVFGDQFSYFRHALVDASRHLDVILAVGDEVVRELHFLSPEMARANIRLTYNGIPAYESSARESAVSKGRLLDYAHALYGRRPDHVFTHVTRMVPSKGLWRDLVAMKYIDAQFRGTGQTALLIVLSTEIGGPRDRDDILHMERWWDWPVAHREGMPDLTGGEALFYAGVQSFNARATNCRVLYINQFGFDRASCGLRMPREMDFWDIRRGSDVEFGQSVYEPFGIAQLEALSFGAICVMSSVCGCAHLVGKVAGPGGTPNVVVADYTAWPEARSMEACLKITREQREAFDDQVARGAAAHVLRRLPRTQEEKAVFVRRGFELASQMSWEVIARDYFLPAIRDIIVPRPVSVVA
jgi:glycosyltransferase involved in cell wall biosynthesis